MLRHMVSSEHLAELSIPKDGELFKVIHLWDRSFPLYYGYYEQCDRDNPAVEPMPIYPDFRKTPVYTWDGAPFVTKMQDVCQHYMGPAGPCRECGDCRYYLHGEELLGICSCPKNASQDERSAQPENGGYEL